LDARLHEQWSLARWAPPVINDADACARRAALDEQTEQVFPAGNVLAAAVRAEVHSSPRARASVSQCATSGHRVGDSSAGCDSTSVIGS
jgi:hypothetical protein